MSDTRKQFEDWFEAESMPAEANWFARDEDGFYKLGYVQWAWEAWEKSRQSCWQEASDVVAIMLTKYKYGTSDIEFARDVIEIFEAKSRGESPDKEDV